jgi:DNA-binding response OmpR family regulator
VFAAEALTLFEPGFEVVTVADLDEAAEWMQTFSPDLLVVSESLEQRETTNFVTGLLAAPNSRHCKVVSVGNGEAAVVHWRHAALGRGAGLSEWLETVRYVLAG